MPPLDMLLTSKSKVYAEVSHFLNEFLFTLAKGKVSSNPVIGDGKSAQKLRAKFVLPKKLRRSQTNPWIFRKVFFCW